MKEVRYEFYPYDAICVRHSHRGFAPAKSLTPLARAAGAKPESDIRNSTIGI